MAELEALMLDAYRAHLDWLRVQFEDGDQMALFAALRVCAGYDLVMPDWLCRAYIRGYDQVLNCEVGTWDEAFGRPYRKGAHIGRLKQRRELRFRVFNRIWKIVHWQTGDTALHDWPAEVTPVDDSLFERVGNEFGIGKTLCSELYYEAKAMMKPPDWASAKK